MLEKSLLLLVQQMGEDMAYWPSRESGTRGATDYRLIPNPLDKAAFVTINGYEQSSDLFVTATLPNGEKITAECSEGRSKDFGLLPAGTKFSYTSGYHAPDKASVIYPRWIKIDELANGGG